MNASPELFSPLLGLTVFNAQKRSASCVSFELTKTPDSPIQAFQFWIEMCDWRLRDGGQEIAHSESGDEEIIAAVSKLNGRQLEAIALRCLVVPEGLTHGATLFFERDVAIRLEGYENSIVGEEIFSARDAAGKSIRYLSDGSTEINTEARAQL